jgi:hypothetical protein
VLFIFAAKQVDVDFFSIIPRRSGYIATGKQLDKKSIEVAVRLNWSP